MAVRPVRLDERHGGRDRAEQLLVRGLGRRQPRALPVRGGAAGRRLGDRRQRLGSGRRCLRRRGRAPFPLPRRLSSSRARPGSAATSRGSPLSKSTRHSAGTASGFSRYSSSSLARSRRSARRRRARSQCSSSKEKPLRRRLARAARPGLMPRSHAGTQPMVTTATATRPAGRGGRPWRPRSARRSAHGASRTGR